MSFKIICNKCEKEIIFEDLFEKYNDEINIASTSMENKIIIQCDECGNQIISK